MPSNSTNEKQRVFELFARYVSTGKARFFQENGLDFVFGRREGAFVWDLDGRVRLIDCHCNGGVFNLGHRHPLLVKKLHQAIQELDIGNHHFVSRNRAYLAEQLAACTPGDLQYTVFGVSGGEAIDTAIKIARKFTGRRKVVAAVGGYHGHTGLALAAGEARFREPFLSSSPDFLHVPYNDPQALEDVLRRERDSGPHGIAAVLLETVPATLGMVIPAPDYFSQVKTICDHNRVLLIIDEIQSGLGRTGKYWGIEHFSVVPDILVTGKGLSGGLYPVTATILRPELEVVFHDDPFAHISTFGGAELGCAVAGQVLQLVGTAEFLEHVNKLAETIREGLQSLQRRVPDVLAEIRQLGLMIGLKTPSSRMGPMLTRACFQAGLLCVFAGNDPSVVQFLPPLIIDTGLAAEILQRLARAVDCVRAAL